MVLAGMMASIALLGIPPLTEDQQGALVTADDGATRDHREAAFWALLENTAKWKGEIGDAAIRLQPDFDALLTDPDRYRGELCRIEGRIDQIEPLVPPYEGVEAWFVRERDNQPVLVYVDFKDREGDRLRFSPGMRIEIIARYYKRYERIADGTGADGRLHVYPAFVGAFPLLADAASSASSNTAALIIPLVIVLGAVFLLVFVLASRARPRNSSPAAWDPIADDGQAAIGLPDDPVEALAILRNRAENGG